MTMMPAGEHRTARYDDAGNIEPCRCHEHAGDDFVTVWDEHESVKAGCHRDCFNRVCNELAACEGVFHACVPHRDAVADTNRRELNRRPAGRCDAQLRHIGNFAQMDMAGDDLVERVADADERLLEIFWAIAVRME